MKDFSELDFINYFSQVYYTVDLTAKNPLIKFYPSSRMGEYLGIEPSRLDDRVYLMNLILKEDFHLRENLRNKVIATCSGGTVRYRIRNDKGQIFWMEEDIQVLSAKDNKPLTLVGSIRDVTETQEVYNKLKNNREKLDLTLKASGLGGWDLDLENGIFYPDKNWKDITGYDDSPEGLSIKTLFTYIYYEDRRLLIYSYLGHKSGKSDSFKVMLRFIHKHEGWIWIQISGHIISRDDSNKPLRITGVFQDISHTRRLETGFNEKLRIEMSISSILTRLNKGGELNSTIHESLKRIASQLRADRAYLCIGNNSKTDKTFYLWSENEQLADKDSLKDLFIKENSSLVRYISTGRPVIVQDINNLTFHLEYEENLFRELQIKAFIIIPLFQDNNLTGFLGVEDIKSPRNWQEQEIYFLSVVSSMLAAAIRRIRMSNDLVKARDKAEEASLLKSSFIANMSHEFRTPLNAIIGFSDLLQSEISDPVMAHRIKTIKNSGQSLLNLMNDILDISKIEADRLDIVKTNVRLDSLINEIIALFQMQAENNSIELKSIIDPLVPKVLSLDKTRVRQILLNLVGNAIKFTKDGEILIDVSCEPVGNTDLINLYIAVEDSGIGISEEDQGVIFESFVQQADTTEKRFQGVGLGLSISKRLAHLMDGDISVNSRLGYGSRFQLELNHVAVREDQVLSAELVQQTEYLQFDSSLVLVVDDNMVNTRLLEEILKKLNLRTVTAYNGQEAMDKALIHSPDLIIMDIRMPVMDGLTAADHLKKSKKTASIPIIALSAYQSPGDLNINKDLFCDYLTKPVSIHTLTRALKPYLANSSPDSPVNQRKERNPVAVSRLISSLSFEDRADLKEKMVEELLPLLEQSSSMIVMSELQEITDIMNYLGKAYNYGELRDLAHGFQGIIEIFDIENIEKNIELLKNALKVV